jgi:hypothetical protein
MVATDSANITDGLGSRPWIAGPPNPVSGLGLPRDVERKMPTRAAQIIEPRGFRTGFVFDAPLTDLSERESIVIPQMGRAEIHAGMPLKAIRMIGEADLPVGSTVDLATGTFYWHALPAYHGTYEFELIPTEGDPIPVRIQIGSPLPRLADQRQ